MLPVIDASANSARNPEGSESLYRYHLNGSSQDTQKRWFHNIQVSNPSSVLMQIASVGDTSRFRGICNALAGQEIVTLSGQKEGAFLPELMRMRSKEAREI
jgi:hypothetical protein